MKTYFLTILLLITLIGAEQTEAAQPRFFITTSAYGDANGKEAEAYLPYFLTQVFNLLKKTYSCVEINDQSTVRTLLDHERQRQLLGSGDENALQNIAQSLGCDYLISLKVTVQNNMALISALCMDNRKAKALSRSMANVPHGKAGLNACDKVTKELIDGLKRYEICPFKGPVKVHVISITKDKQTEEYPVYCNKTDGTYHKVTTIDNTADDDWNLEKTGKYSATGSIRFKLDEETKVEEENNCYKCSSGREGGRTYFEKKTLSADVQGLSNESQSYGIKVDDARAEITFLDNDTYIIRIKATSKQGDLKERTEKHAEGTCDNINTKPETIDKKADVPLNEIFGPFTGNAQDKTLTYKDTIKRIDPNTKEETTIIYEFNLTRE